MYEQIDSLCQLYPSDCIETMKTLTDQSIDLVIADPPYKLEMPIRNGVTKLLESKNIKPVNEAWDKFTLDDYIDFSERWLRECFRLLKPTGSVAVFGTYHNIGLINFVMQRNSWMIINEIAWYKRNAVPNLACRRLTASHETILWAAAAKRYIFNYSDLKDGNFPEDYLKHQGKQMRSVWDIPTNSAKNVGHPTQKPVKLYERIMTMACRKADDTVILDPFAGSGTCGLAARQFGYRVIMIEREPKYQQIIRDRISPPMIP
jgi:site-specific DNA-methyltransferase (adenine-specific)